MKQVRRKTDKITKELISLRQSRKSIDDFFFSYMINFTDNCQLMHSFISEENKNKKLFMTAYRQYYVFLVSSWETFFRDVFVYVHTCDEDAVLYILDRLKPATDTFDEGGIELPEILSKSFNFQRLDDLEYAFDGMWGESFLNYIFTKNMGSCGIKGKICKYFIVEELFNNWRDIIEKSFTIRHNIVHDANYRPEINIEFIRQAEAIFLLAPQVATHFISEKYNLKRFVLSNGDFSVPNIFTVEDILSKDWVITK